MKIQREKAQSLAMEDFGLEDDDEVDSDSDGQEKAFKVITNTLAFHLELFDIFCDIHKCAK